MTLACNLRLQHVSLKQREQTTPASATTAAPSPLSQWRVRANASSSNVIDVTFFKPGSLPTRPLLPGESPSRPGDSDITERFLRCRDSEPAATATAFRITWGTFDGRLAPFPSEVVAHIVDHIDGTCGSSSISWSPSRFVEPRRVTSASTASGTSPLLHTKHTRNTSRLHSCNIRLTSLRLKLTS